MSFQQPCHPLGDGQRGGQSGGFDAEQIDQARQAMGRFAVDPEIGRARSWAR